MAPARRHVGAIPWLAVLAIAAAVVAFVLGCIEFGVRRRVLAAALAAAAVLALWLLAGVRRGYDWCRPRSR